MSSQSPRVSLFRSIRRKFARSLEIRGLWGSIGLAVKQPYLWFRFHKTEDRRNKTQQEFDRKFGVDTSGIVYLSDLDIASPNFVHGTRYGPTLKKTFDEVVGQVPIAHSDFVFIDVGSGKGAVLLYASEYPFQRVVGVEFSRELHEIAQKNIARYQNPARRCF